MGYYSYFEVYWLLNDLIVKNLSIMEAGTQQNRFINVIIVSLNNLFYICLLIALNQTITISLSLVLAEKLDRPPRD